jgi:hypothetical protein
MFAGYRMVRKKIEGKVEAIPQAPRLNLTKNLFKNFESCKVLTLLQYGIVQAQLQKCTEKTSPEYVARLLALTEKSVTIPKEKTNENMG